MQGLGGPMTQHPNVMQWPELAAVPSLKHGFIGRIAGVDVATDRDTAMARLAPRHDQILRDFGIDPKLLATAEQVHGADVAVVHGPGRLPGVDGLITALRGQPLGIYVADCAAVFFVDTIRGVIGLSHSGKKGTERRIAGATVEKMGLHFDSRPQDIIAIISPCIRPPHYEIDFAADIRKQLAEVGVERVIDSGICTATANDRFYSYRLENGKTGRMLAFLELRG